MGTLGHIQNKITQSTTTEAPGWARGASEAMEMAMTVMNAATLQPKPLRPKGPYLLPNPRRVINFKASSLHNPQVSSIGAPTLVGQFDPTIPIERAVTPPSSWYTDPSFYSLELDTLFYRGWQAAGQLLFNLLVISVWSLRKTVGKWLKKIVMSFWMVIDFQDTLNR